jgi:hypothetical protein
MLQKKDSAPPILQRTQKIDAAHAVFRTVLGSATPDGVFQGRQLIIVNQHKLLVEFTGNKQRLAEAVLGADFPRVKGPIELEHYTTVPSLKEIARSRQLHLRSLVNNLGLGEFESFATDHALDGYFAQRGKGLRVFEELSSDLYFLSMTKPKNPDEAELWNNFANEGKGVCLQLRVTPRPASDLRDMGYKSSSTALKKINNGLKAQDLVYVPWGISRICAFYLPNGFQFEREIRLLIKKHKGGIDQTVDIDGQKHWPISLAAAGSRTGDLWADIELVGVRRGSRCKEDAVKAVLQGSPFENVPVS